MTYDEAIAIVAKPTVEAVLRIREELDEADTVPLGWLAVCAMKAAKAATSPALKAALDEAAKGCLDRLENGPCPDYWTFCIYQGHATVWRPKESWSYVDSEWIKVDWEEVDNSATVIISKTEFVERYGDIVDRLGNKEARDRLWSQQNRRAPETGSDQEDRSKPQ